MARRPRYTRSVVRLNSGASHFNTNAARSARQQQPDHPEHELQASCFRNFATGVAADQALFVAIPNGEGRTSLAAQRLIEEGVHPGALDVLLVLPQGRVHWVEFKVQANPIRNTKTTYPSKNQKTFMGKLDRLGHAWTVVRTPEEWQALLDRLGVRNLVRLY